MKKVSAAIPTAVVANVKRSEMTPRQVGAEFQTLLDAGACLRPAGTAQSNPLELLASGQRPKHKIELFDKTFYLTNTRQIPELRFLVCYVVENGSQSSSKPASIYPRIFYKDLSLAWRCASHLFLSDDDLWVGKGDVRVDWQDGHEVIVSDESTTDLPLEIQVALENLLSWSTRPPNQRNLLKLILRRAPSERVEPYQDFTQPRKLAAANADNLINGGNSIASFAVPNDPQSLEVVAGFEPDFVKGIVSQDLTRSRLYGGPLKRFRILSKNKLVQYYFFVGERHVWIMPPQALTTQLSSFGVRTISVAADDDLFIPGYEYHYYEDTQQGPKLYSQIPEGFAGEVCPVDPDKADASLWLDKIPMIEEFRKKVLR